MAVQRKVGQRLVAILRSTAPERAQGWLSSCLAVQAQLAKWSCGRGVLGRNSERAQAALRASSVRCPGCPPSVLSNAANWGPLYMHTHTPSGLPLCAARRIRRCRWTGRPGGGHRQPGRLPAQPASRPHSPPQSGRAAAAGRPTCRTRPGGTRRRRRQRPQPGLHMAGQRAARLCGHAATHCRDRQLTYDAAGRAAGISIPRSSPCSLQTSTQAKRRPGASGADGVTRSSSSTCWPDAASARPRRCPT